MKTREIRYNLYPGVGILYTAIAPLVTLFVLKKAVEYLTV
jgi:hypothetical protein